MGTPELLLIAVGLSMDAFAISACIGLGTGRDSRRFDKAVTAGLYFGAAQAIMPVAGYFAGVWFAGRIAAFSAYIAFIILAVIGGKMIKESFSEPGAAKNGSYTGFRKMAPLAVATSVDALAVGVSLAFLNVSILTAAVLIGVVTFILCVLGVLIGGVLGARFKSKAEFAGGLILILMGARILLQHFGVF